ncbi:acyl transferase domain-containing protein [Aspergillus spectabilis]
MTHTQSGVAIIGMACRVCNSISTPQHLWSSLLAQEDNVSEIPPSRWATYYTRNPRNKEILNKTVHMGYFMPTLDSFDAQFFGISPKEAAQMDPQQRVSLEVAYEALQDAGIPPKSMRGSGTAVFWGVGSGDYSRLVLEDLPAVDAWIGIGSAYCGVPNRISYHLDLRGPSVAVDAACESSLVAVHNGVNAILGGEATVAIVGGVNALYGPGLTVVLQRAGALAADGRSQAIKDGDHVLGIIRGSAVAHNSKTKGIMAPSAAAQRLVAEKALGVAGLEARDVGYVEAHATSTPLGDPTEIEALGAVYWVGRDQRPCYIGSIKPNIGHLEAGAGIMGLIKTVLAVQKGMLPPQVNLKTLNSRVDWERCSLEVVQRETEWPGRDGHPRRAAVCSSGYGGTVSHVILEECLQQTAEPSLGKDADMLLLVSAPQKQRLAIVAESLLSWMRANATKKLASICTAMATRRDHHEFRTSTVVRNVHEAIEALENLSNGSTSVKWMTSGRCLPATASKETAWVFPGHGAQWTDMGKDLLENHIFRGAIEPLDEIIRSEIDSSPLEWLRNGDFATTDRIQILTYIMQISLVAVLRARGVFPDAVIGHSVGEIAASVVAGALLPEEGAMVVTRRALLYRKVMGHGSMIQVNKPARNVAADLEGLTDVAVAINSSPSSCVVSGPKDKITLIAEKYRDQGVKTATVKTDVAFHSPVMAALGDPLMSSLDGILHPTHPSVMLYSTTMSDPRAQTLRSPEFWRNNMINRVNLLDAITCALEDEYRVFLEVASHPIVSHSITETLMEAGIEDFLVVPTLRRDSPADRSILHALGQLYCGGVDIDWRVQMPGAWAQGLPVGPWCHKPTSPKLSACQTSVETHDINRHTLLGHRIAVAGSDTVVYNTFLDHDSKPFQGIILSWAPRSSQLAVAA